MDPDEGRGGVSSSNNNGRYTMPVARPSSPTQSHSHSQAQSREVLSDSSTPIAENWCVTKVRARPDIYEFSKIFSCY